MLKITAISAAQAKGYYEKDDYYAQDSEQEPVASIAASEWFGKAAEELGLKGGVKAETFQSLLEGQTLDGRSLHAKGINPEKHRAGYDCTFSAPKSYSVAALLGDERLIELQQEAVKTTLSVAQERYAQDREWNVDERKQEAVVTGNFAAALFPHDTSRNLDPNLHTHAVVLNCTQDSNGSYRALYIDEVFAHRKLLDQVYLNQLAHGAQGLGYKIEPTKDGFELKGYDPELLDCFSSRRKEIEAHVARQIENGAQAAGRLYEQAALATRSRKQNVGRDALLEGWQQVISDQGLELPQNPIEARDLSESGQEQAAIAAREGISHAEEREAVFKRGKVEQFALGNHLGQQSWNQLQDAIEETNQLVHADIATDKYTTQYAIKREIETIQMMEIGKGAVSAIASSEEVEAIAPDTLTKGQKQALELSATTCDQIIGWQGVAGAGKTYTLNLYRQLAEANGYRVRGFAPSAEGAKVLGDEAGVRSDTVASLIHTYGVEGTPKKEVWIVDEAGLLSAKDAHALLKRAVDQQARVILVGDTQQLSAVEAGNPFKSLQSAGMPTAKLEESLRQKSERLKWAVEAIARGDLGSGFSHLDQAGSIRGVTSPAERQESVVKDYLALSPQQRDKTLVISNTNAERLAITQGIRAGLQAEGRLSEDTFMLTSLKPRNLTIAQAKYSKNYAQGDVIIPTQDYRKQGMTKGEQYEVIELEPESNQLTLASSDGSRFKVDPSQCDRKTVYEPQQVPLAPGDQLRWTRNDRPKARRNGQHFTVDAIDENGMAIARYTDGATEFIDLQGRQFADYSLVSTTYAAQGKTADRILVGLDDSTGKEGFYVAASRAKYELRIYTDDAAALRKLAERSGTNENASDYLNLLTYEKSHAQNKTPQTETDNGTVVTARTDHRTDGGISVGGRAGKSLAATLSGDSRTEERTGNLQQSLDQFDAENPIPGIDADSVSRSVAGFVERREVERNDTAEFIAQLTQTTIEYFNTKGARGDVTDVDGNIKVVGSPNYWIWYGHNRENGETPRLLVQDKKTKSVLFETLLQDEGWKAKQVKPEAAACLEQASRELAAGQRRELQILKPQMEL
jgi:conjugative relaxase-like TrwC/TraI family protein